MAHSIHENENAMILAACLMLSVPRFQIIESAGSYRFLDANGHQFRSMGVCCINGGQDAKEYDPLNPGFGWSKFYKTREAFAAETSSRLKAWGFNTVGAWSDHELFAKAGLYQMPVLHLGAAGIPWVDPWDPETIKKVRGVAEPQIAKWKSLPGLVGYFSDNELGWWIGAIFEWGWKPASGSLGREKILALTKDYYPTWESLKKDFDVGSITGYDQLAKEGSIYLKSGSNGMKLVRAWLGILADQYYKVCRQVIKDLDPDTLYLGDRYISGYYPEVAKAAGQYCDVVSTNLNADWPNGAISPYFLDGLWNLTRRPILITEYYACAMENRSGNMNDTSGFPTVTTQRERAQSAKRQTQTLLSTPYVIGAHWFQYYDEPTHGRGDGENFNMGLVDIDNRPYEDLVKTFRVRPKPMVRAKSGIPYLAPAKARNLANWPHDLAVLPRDTGEPRGDAFAVWNESGIAIALHWNEDRFFESLYRDGKVPAEDRAFAEASIGSHRVRATIAERNADVDGAVALSIDTGVRNSLVLRIPANKIGKPSLQAGMSIPIRIRLYTRARGYQMVWSKPVDLQILEKSK